jgi:putative Ca2+/H+ antiporter (TMEM165/GDT1 family)
MKASRIAEAFIACAPSCEVHEPHAADTVLWSDCKEEKQLGLQSVLRLDVFHPTQLVCLYSNWTDGSQVKLVLKAARQAVGVLLGKMLACWPLNKVL